LMAAVDSACEYGARAQRDREQGQGGLFAEVEASLGGAADGSAGDGLSVGDGLKTVTLPDAKPWTETEQLGFEKETLGLYWSGHPVDRYAGELKEYGARTTLELADQKPAPAADDTWRA